MYPTHISSWKIKPITEQKIKTFTTLWSQGCVRIANQRNKFCFIKDENGMNFGVKEDKRPATVFYILNFRSGKYYFNQEKVRECLWCFGNHGNWRQKWNANGRFNLKRLFLEAVKKYPCMCFSVFLMLDVALEITTIVKNFSSSLYGPSGFHVIVSVREVVLKCV